jgi:putative ABC transport system substrate-binding protein
MTRSRTDPSRGNDADAVALLRVGLAQLQAVQAERARIAATAPTTRVVRVGLLTSYWAREYRGLFIQRLGERGWVHGRNLVMEYRLFADQPERLPELAEELVRERVDVIVADALPAARAAKAATAGTTIPVVFLLFEDPVAAGLVDSYARPGGNLTGVTTPNDPSLTGKRLDLLAEAVPSIRRVGVLVDAPSGPHWHELEQVARARDLELLPLAVRNRGELVGALAGGAAGGVQALLMTDLLPYQGGDFQDYLIAATRFAQQQRLPLIVNGWAPNQLLSYSDSLPAKYTAAAAQVDRVLRGAKPAQLPVEQVKEFDLIVNLGVAQTLGLTIAPSVLARATEITDPGAMRPRRVR